MTFYFRTRKSVYFNIALLFLLVCVWVVSYTQPVLRSFLKEEHVFFGKVSYAAIPSIFGGSNIPFLDKTYFQLNGDNQATFVLYASQQMMDDMSDWFSFAQKNVENISLQVVAVRISDSKFIVKNLSTKDYELDWETVSEYQLYYSLIAIAIALFAFLSMIVFIVLGIRCKR